MPSSGDSIAFDGGSFRDRSARVVCDGERVFRLLDAQALAAFRGLQSSFLPRAIAAGRVVATREVEPPFPLMAPWVATLEHERIPFVSYPYEWSFGMLRAAALLTLDLVEEATLAAFTLKDASSYNVQWRGAHPVFIDLGSFERERPGGVWVGYRQFCELFLNPLLLAAYRGIPFQPWLRGRLAGIPPSACRAAMSARDLFRPGVLRHVVLHAALDRRVGDSRRDLEGELREAGFGRAAVLANVRSLRRLVAGLRVRPSASAWSGYTACDHVAADRARKSELVERVVGTGPRKLAWDLGANDGHFSRIAARGSDFVVAMDADAEVAERLFAALTREGTETILPLVVDLSDPSPGAGWRGRERPPLEERGRPQLVLALAVLHHLVIGANLPLGEVLDWLVGLGAELVIEFVTRDDPHVADLLRRRHDAVPEWELEQFEQELARRYRIAWREPLPSGSRFLFHAQPAASAVARS